jgi:hypothetical protein
MKKLTFVKSFLSRILDSVLVRGFISFPLGVLLLGRITKEPRSESLKDLDAATAGDFGVNRCYS